MKTRGGNKYTKWHAKCQTNVIQFVLPLVVSLDYRMPLLVTSLRDSFFFVLFLRGTAVFNLRDKGTK